MDDGRVARHAQRVRSACLIARSATCSALYRMSITIRKEAAMKYGMRKPSWKKSLSARTKGRATRAVKRALIPGYGKKGMGWLASQAQTVQHGLQEDHVQLVRPVQVVRAKGGNHMCSNPDTYEFRLSLDLPQQSAVPTDTFSALREVHEYSAENGPRFHTAAEMFDSLGI